MATLFPLARKKRTALQHHPIVISLLVNKPPQIFTQTLLNKLIKNTLFSPSKYSVLLIPIFGAFDITLAQKPLSPGCLTTFLSLKRLFCNQMPGGEATGFQRFRARFFLYGNLRWLKMECFEPNHQSTIGSNQSRVNQQSTIFNHQLLSGENVSHIARRGRRTLSEDSETGVKRMVPFGHNR
jgi:hypothetical protein